MNTINKNGIIKEIRQNELKISILSCSSCSSCSIKNYCAGSESKEKEITVRCYDTDKYKIGEEVYVSIDEQQAFKSILLAYVFPLILTILTIISVISYTNNEIIGGISGIIILIPYYFGLFLAKDKLKSGFEFRISKKDA